MNSEMFLTGIGLIALMATWKLMWIPSVLDTARDRLFDLRDGRLQEYFTQNSLGFDHPMYIKLRNLLNGHLRHTESVTLWEWIFAVAMLTKNAALDSHKSKEIDARFYTKDPALKGFIEEIRLLSAAIVIAYMAQTSLLVVALFLISHPINFVKMLFSKSSGLLKSAFSPTPRSNSRLAMEIYALA